MILQDRAVQKHGLIARERMRVKEEEEEEEEERKKRTSCSAEIRSQNHVSVCPFIVRRDLKKEAVYEKLSSDRRICSVFNSSSLRKGWREAGFPMCHLAVYSCLRPSLVLRDKDVHRHLSCCPCSPPPPSLEHFPLIWPDVKSDTDGRGHQWAVGVPFLFASPFAPLSHFSSKAILSIPSFRLFTFFPHPISLLLHVLRAPEQSHETRRQDLGMVEGGENIQTNPAVEKRTSTSEQLGGNKDPVAHKRYNLISSSRSSLSPRKQKCKKKNERTRRTKIRVEIPLSLSLSLSSLSRYSIPSCCFSHAAACSFMFLSFFPPLSLHRSILLTLVPLNLTLLLLIFLPMTHRATWKAKRETSCPLSPFLLSIPWCCKEMRDMTSPETRFQKENERHWAEYE